MGDIFITLRTDDGTWDFNISNIEYIGPFSGSLPSEKFVIRHVSGALTYLTEKGYGILRETLKGSGHIG